MTRRELHSLVPWKAALDAWTRINLLSLPDFTLSEKQAMENWRTCSHKFQTFVWQHRQFFLYSDPFYRGLLPPSLVMFPE